MTETATVRQLRTRIAELQTKLQRADPVEPKRIAMRDECCRNCRFWGNEECYRFPPQVIRPDGDASYWPTTGQEEWCGEWRSK